MLLTGEGDKAFCCGRRPERPRATGGYVGRRRARAAQRARPPAPDPLAADPGHRARQRLRHRRRARAARRVRPVDRARERDLRPGGPEGGLVRRRVRHRAAGAAGGRQEGQGDLVPVPPVHRRGGAGRWAWSTRSCRSPTWRPRACVGERDPGHEPHRDPLPQVRVPRRHRRPGRAPGVRGQHDRPVLHDRRGARGSTAFLEKRPPDYRKYPRRP